MKIDGIAGLAAQSQPVPKVLDTSSSAANGAGNAQPAYTPAPAAAPASPSQGEGFLAGRLQMDMHFALAQSYSSTVSSQSANGYKELRTSVEKRFQADYHFDMSFIAQLDSTAQKMGSLGTDVLNQFVGAASKLSTLNEKDLQNFTQSADNLFNELAKTTGVDGAAFDGAKQLLKSSVGDFIHMVQGAIAGGPGADTAGAVPGQPPPAELAAGQPPMAELAPGAPGTPPPSNGGGIDFQKFRDETVKKFDEAFASYLQGMMASAQKMMQEYQQAFLDTLTKKQDGAAGISGKDDNKTPPPPKADEWAGNPPGAKSGGAKESAGEAA